jgi:hypothetical protein
MAKEPKIQSDNLPEGTVMADKEKNQATLWFFGDWSAKEWLWGIISFVVCVAIMVMVDEFHPVSRLFSRAIQAITLLVFVFLLRQIDKNKKIK